MTPLQLWVIIFILTDANLFIFVLDEWLDFSVYFCNDKISKWEIIIVMDTKSFLGYIFTLLRPGDVLSGAVAVISTRSVTNVSLTQTRNTLLPFPTLTSICSLLPAILLDYLWSSFLVSLFLVGQKIYTADWDGSDRPDIVQQHLLSTTALVIHDQYNAMTILADFGKEVQAVCVNAIQKISQIGRTNSSAIKAF